ncbi:hypothetical protein CDL12_23881 [Handroanthus impetiginosus]|uniref:Uncharacterized protein n=1 Tax=Handroanthus impetiginosus TaxID=429701 RepID=A0A2G9GE78_9LAMI|nr:hypothetical protein CDL12_23881 [Handroanthus impetiginosus]
MILDNYTQKIHPILWLILAIKQTKNYLTNHIQTLVHRENQPLSLVPKRSHSLRWKVAMSQRNKRLRAPSAKPEWPVQRDGSPGLKSGPRTLMLTNGSPLADSQSSGSTSSWLESEVNAESSHITRANPWSSGFASTMVHSLDGEYWLSSTEDIKWDSMFQNLKPT